MPYDVVKCLPQSSFFNNEEIAFEEEPEDKFFDVIIKNKHYPSCYQYNVLIMLAKRLINEENRKEEVSKAWRNRPTLDRKLVERIANA